MLLGKTEEVESVHGALLHLKLPANREPFFSSSAIQNRRGSVFPDSGTVLKAVSGASPDQPDIFHFGMTVYEEVPVGCVLVLAYAALDQRRIADLR